MTINCENGENIHGVGGNTVIVTEDGVFCSPVCAKQAEDIRLFDEACEDPDSWYWDSH